MELPSSAELEEASEILLGLAEEDFDALSWPEILGAYRAFCTHPVVLFARAACDLVGTEEEE